MKASKSSMTGRLSGQFINESANLQSRHCGMVLAAIQRFWVVGWGSSIRLFVYSSIRPSSVFICVICGLFVDSSREDLCH